MSSTRVGEKRKIGCLSARWEGRGQVEQADPQTDRNNQEYSRSGQASSFPQQQRPYLWSYNKACSNNYKYKPQCASMFPNLAANVYHAQEKPTKRRPKSNRRSKVIKININCYRSTQKSKKSIRNSKLPPSKKKPSRMPPTNMPKSSVRARREPTRIKPRKEPSSFDRSIQSRSRRGNCSRNQQKLSAVANLQEKSTRQGKLQK